MLDSEAEALTRHERPRAVDGLEAGDERPDVALGLHQPSQRPQGVAGLDDAGSGDDRGGTGRIPSPVVTSCTPPGASEGADTEQDAKGGEGQDDPRHPPPGRFRG